MNLLAIDTSTELATVALMVQEEIVSEEQGSMRQHAQFLLPMIQRLLALTGCLFNQLDGIVFGRGPGSFTGLRIACSVAKGLAYAHDLPVFPVSGLAAIAYEAQRSQHASTAILAMIDARMHQVYWRYFTSAAETIEEQVSSAEDIILASEEPIILAGVGFEPYVEQLPAAIQTRILQQISIFPTATSMIRLVQAGEVNAVSAAEALPVYIRNQVTHGAAKGASNG